MSNQPQPGGPPNWNQIIENNILNMKKRTSQIKGEMTDGLTEVIAKNFEQFYQIGQQLAGQIEQKDKEIVSLKKDLEEVYTAHPELKITKEAQKKKPVKK